MKHQASGTFEVAIQMQGEADNAGGVSLGRMSLDKKFAGDEGSAGYVAIERVTGTLQGRQGSFVFQHTGVMNRGESQLSITVVPDSGTEELTGIAGEFLLTIQDGKHHYIFTYSLPEA